MEGKVLVAYERPGQLIMCITLDDGRQFQIDLGGPTGEPATCPNLQAQFPSETATLLAYANFAGWAKN